MTLKIPIRHTNLNKNVNDSVPEEESTQMRTSEKSEREEWVSAYITDFCRLHGKGF